jgi:PiT family inorganic phosphate transporter
MTLVIVLTILFALLYDLTNGWNDAANSIATVVGTRVLSPWKALAMGAAFNFAGALFSSEVARTVGHGLADARCLTPVTFLAAAMVAPVWITLCTLRGLPISCSHSLLGGLIGAILASGGYQALNLRGITKIIGGIFTSPIIGFFLAGFIMVIVAWTFRRVRAKTASAVFGKLQLVSAAAMAFSHGTGDAQKAMGIISGALLAAGLNPLDTDGRLVIPFWVRILCAATIAVGTAVGGWAVIRTLGTRLAHLRPCQGFAAETAGAVTILVNTLTGVPISTTHSITGAIMGVGATQGVKTVRWSMGKKIVYAWIFTFPVCIFGGALICWLLSLTGLGGCDS